MDLKIHKKTEEKLLVNTDNKMLSKT